MLPSFVFVILLHVKYFILLVNVIRDKTLKYFKNLISLTKSL